MKTGHFLNQGDPLLGENKIVEEQYLPLLDWIEQNIEPSLHD